MPRERSPNRDQAFTLWFNSDGQMLLKDIASELGVSDSQVRKWKNHDEWSKRLKGNVTEPNSNVTKRKAGALTGNQNAVGNIGGSAPIGNSNAVTHGFFRRIFPDDEDTHAILEAIETLEPLDILWQNIVIQYTAIARAQRIMFVQDATDHSEFTVVQQLNADRSEMTTKLVQPAWDKHGEFLKAQSRAIKTLEGLIARYSEMLPNSPKAEEHQLKLEKLRAEIGKIVGGNGPTDDSLSIVVDYGDDDG